MPRASRGGPAVVELLRLGVVLLLTAAGFLLGELLVDRPALADVIELETARLLASVLGALVGYLVGGILARAVVRGVDTATVRLDQVPAAVLIAGSIGAGVGALVGVVLLLPVLLLPGQRFTVPVAVLASMTLAYAGARLGAARGAELGRYVGVRGRLDVHTPSRGGGVKLVDSSVLIDGRIVEVARSGFVEGTLVVPTFVLTEVQQLADAGEERRRALGQRGLRTVEVLQSEGLVAVEVTDEDVPGTAEVDGKLAALARERGAALLTNDGNLARIAEVAGVRVLNLHVLAEAVRPPVLPGDRVQLKVVKAGREPGQGVGYLGDGTMVVVEEAAEEVGRELDVDVTSIMQGRQGRMLFGVQTDQD